MKKFFLIFALIGCSSIEPVVCEDYGLMRDGDAVIHQAFLPIGVTCENRACDEAVDFWYPYAAHDLDGYRIRYDDEIDVAGRTYLEYVTEGDDIFALGEIVSAKILISTNMIEHSAESMVIAHEIGHVMGLDHDTCPNSVMTTGKLRSLKKVKISKGDKEALDDSH